MRRIFFMFLSLMTSLMMYSQNNFELTKEGFKLEDGSKYFVIDVEGKDAAAIKNALLSSLNSVLSQGTDTNIEIVDDQQVLVSGVKTGLFKIKWSTWGDYIMDYDYTLSFRIKDNKIRIDAPIIRNLGMHKFGRIECRMVVSGDPNQYKKFKRNQFIFDPKDGKVRDSKTKSILENFTNSLLSDILSPVINIDNEW